MLDQACIARPNSFLCRFGPHETYIDTVISIVWQFQETSHSQFMLIWVALWAMRKIIVPSHYPLEHELKHPDKTFIGRIAKEFDFLGYHFRMGNLKIAMKTIDQFVARARRLYEQEPREEAFS